ncbi:unnamed protein product [Rotaria sp. Silwood2]|nr:unnamed protein product [Rotaria sp. Silwood2]
MKPTDSQWIKAPGVEFFKAIRSALWDPLPLIVEDLGILTKEVFDLRDQFNLPGMRIFRFGFLHHPHNYIRNCVAYKGTHDHPTVLGWWTQHASDNEKKTFVTYI